MGYILHVLCVTLLSLASCPRLVAASNVLGFGAAGGRSHQFAILRVGQELQTRGHNFTMLVSSQEGLDLGKLGSRSFEGLKVVHFAGPRGIGTAEWFANLPRDVAQAMHQFQADQMKIAQHLHGDTATLQQLRETRFDAYLKDAWYWPADLLQDLLDVPSIDVLPFPIGMPLFEQSLSIPNELAYVPQLGVDYTTNMTFLQRTHNYLQAWLMRLFVMRLSKSYIRQFVAQTGQHMRSLETGRSAASAVVASVDWSVEYPFPLPPKVQEIPRTICSSLHLTSSSWIGPHRMIYWDIQQ